MGNKAILKKKEVKHMARIPQIEILTAMKELSQTGFKMLMYYYSRNDGWVFNDNEIARSIDSTERMVKKHRKELIDNGYLLIQKGQVDVYFIGKGAVEEFHKDVVEDTYDEDPISPVISKKQKQI